MPKKQILNIGDYVRVGKDRISPIMSKLYENFSREIFKIDKIDTRQNPTTYKLVDLNKTPIKGSFYRLNLKKVEDPKNAINEQDIDKILRKKGNKVLVSWIGWGPAHNSWINSSSIYKGE